MAFEYLLLLTGGLALIAAVYFPIRWWLKRQAARTAALETPVGTNTSANQAIGTPPLRWWQHPQTDVIGALLLAIAVAIGVNDNSVLMLGGLTDRIPPDMMVLIVRVLAFAQVSPLVVRRRYPVGTGIAVAVIASVHTLIRTFPLIMFADVAILISLYTVTAYGPKWAGKAGLLTAFLGAAAIGLRSATFTTIQTGVTFALILTAVNFTPWALGLMRRAQAAAVNALHEKTAALAEVSEILTERNFALVQRNDALDLHRVNLEYRTRQLAIERDQQAQIAAAAERVRIAREMHDIVGHAIANIIVLANGARVAAAQNPDVAVDALAAISESGTEALATTKQLLGVLRSPGAPAELRPSPGNIGSATAADPLSIRALLAEVRDAGTLVELREYGEPRQLSAAATNTYYRVCQEALTNARKYGAPDTPVVVQLNWAPDALTLVVENELAHDATATAGKSATADTSVTATKPAMLGELATPVPPSQSVTSVPPVKPISKPTSHSQGYGLIGMQERAALIGATLVAGPAADAAKWEVRMVSKPGTFNLGSGD